MSKPLVRFALPDGVPGLVRAASLALAVARFCGANTWGEFVDKASAGDAATLKFMAQLDVDEMDSVLVAEHDAPLRLLRVRPLVTVAVCPVCQGWVLVSGGAPTKCKTTLRCDGKPVKASIATKAKQPVPDVKA